MFRISLRTALLGTSVLMMMMSLSFSRDGNAYYVEKSATGEIAVAPNSIAAYGTAGYAIAAGLTLIAAAIVDRHRAPK